jgi:hypothetical protein
MQCTLAGSAARARAPACACLTRVWARSPLGRGMLTGKLSVENLDDKDFRRHSPWFQGENAEKARARARARGAGARGLGGGAGRSGWGGLLHAARLCSTWGTLLGCRAPAPCKYQGSWRSVRSAAGTENIK